MLFTFILLCYSHFVLAFSFFLQHTLLDMLFNALSFCHGCDANLCKCDCKWLLHCTIGNNAIWWQGTTGNWLHLIIIWWASLCDSMNKTWNISVLVIWEMSVVYLQSTKHFFAPLHAFSFLRPEWSSRHRPFKNSASGLQIPDYSHSQFNTFSVVKGFGKLVGSCRSSPEHF